MTPSPELGPGTVLGGTYRIVRALGHGGMGQLYEAEHLRLAGRYAIKVLHADLASQPDLLTRFQREADITSRLRHPHIVSVLDFNVTPAGLPFLALEFLEGTELGEEVKRHGPVSLARAVDLSGQIASALGAAHAHGVVHRDLKPQNVFLVRLAGDDREVVKVLDFGISQMREARTRLTQANSVMGTPQYMAPEQALGRIDELDHRVDQFALAAIVYELLAGCEAFRGQSVPAVLYQVVHEMPPELRSLNPAVPPAVQAVVVRGLAKSAAARFASVREFQTALAEAARHATAPLATAPLATAELATRATERADSIPVVSTPARAEVPKTTFGSATAELGADDVGEVPVVRGRGRVVLAAALVTVAFFGWWLSGLVRGRSVDPGAAVAPSAATGGAAGAAAPTTPEKEAAVVPAPVPRSPVRLKNAPPGLLVLVDGVRAELPLSLPRVSRSIRLRFEAPGYRHLVTSVDGSRESHELTLQMPAENPRDARRPRQNVPPTRPTPPAPGTKAPERDLDKIITDI